MNLYLFHNVWIDVSVDVCIVRYMQFFSFFVPTGTTKHLWVGRMLPQLRSSLCGRDSLFIILFFKLSPLIYKVKGEWLKAEGDFPCCLLLFYPLTPSGSPP